MLAPALIGPACGPAAQPTAAELYLLALGELRSELRLDPPVPIHPLPAMLSPGEAPGEVRVQHFNQFDTLLVASIIARDSAAYRPCEITPAGSCAARDGGVSLVLSELQENGPNGVSLIAIVTDRRARTDVQQYYRIRLKRGLLRWGVVELRRLE